MRTRTRGARAFIPAALAVITLFSLTPIEPVAAAEPVAATEPTPSPSATPTVEPTPTDDADTVDDTVDDTVEAPAATSLPVTVASVSIVRRPRVTEAQQIIKVARGQIGDPWRYGANGPRSFDCSGLVLYAYRKAGDAKALRSGRLRSARALYAYFKRHGKASRHNPKVGDLVIWGRGAHVGIYIGNGKAISTLMSGVRVHRVRAVRASFTAYLHTGMWKKPA